MFDYNSTEEKTVDSLMQSLIMDYSRWIIEDIVYDEMKKLEPDIRSQVLEMIQSTKGIDLGDIYDHVRCPKCYSIVTKN